MDIFDAIENRHCYRGGFTDDPVSRKDLTKIVECGIKAPSGCNAQTTSFVIVDNPETIAAIAQHLDRQVVREARAIIACVVDHKQVYKEMSFGAEDCAAAIENMLLAITALGYATVWIDGALRVDDIAQKIGRILKVPENLQVRVILPIGRPAKPVTAREKLPFNQRAWFDSYGGQS